MRLHQCQKLWMTWRSANCDIRLFYSKYCWSLCFTFIYYSKLFITDGIETKANGAQLAEVSVCKSYNSWWAQQKWSEGGWTFISIKALLPYLPYLSWSITLISKEHCVKRKQPRQQFYQVFPNLYSHRVVVNFSEGSTPPCCWWEHLRLLRMSVSCIVIILAPVTS